MSVKTTTLEVWVRRTISVLSFSVLSFAVSILCIVFNVSTSFAQTGATMVFQNFDGPLPPLNKEGIGYPTWFQGVYLGGIDGGTFVTSIDTGKKIAGAGSLKMHFTSGAYLYAQWNPYDGFSRDFARIYSSNPAGWRFNTYNRMRYWLWNPIGGEPEMFNGGTNFYMGTYVKRVTNPNMSSDEDGGNHFYHPFNILRDTWSLCTFNMHPGHGRGAPGGVDTGNVPYPTTPAYGGLGDPPNTYNYFDTLTRWYISGNGGGTAFPRDYWLDEIQLYQELYPENDDQVYGICASYTAATSRIFLTWNRFKDENAINHEVRYAFSNIHGLGWNNATPAPNGTITPPGWQGNNAMVYDTKAINVSGQSQIYLAIKPQNSSVFSQVVLPLTSGTVVSLSPPTNLRVIQ